MKENMPRDEENYVALFIDWDNLAISTSVDFAGAVPDVRAIVKAAQRSGTVLLARAYAEWNVSSDRLSVYRAGVEPVYAPTFRFEPEPGSQVPRGKSLADPCLVTDCIDTMHLMPNVNVFCLVSGDKDLIPIVRLAQLRGKRVVVIGPDFVAAILREMADEYIPYRGLVETSESPAIPETSLHGSRQRRVAAPQARIAPVATTPLPRTQPTPLRSTPALAPITRPAAVETNGNGNGLAGDTGPATTGEPPAVEAASPEEALDSGPLFDIIGTIVREREQAGKPRLRATNLKDQLLARISGFDERKYGFGRFKDLLTAAEKAGFIVVSRTGPVQWVASASGSPAIPAPVATTAITIVPEPVEPAVESTESSAPPAVEAADSSDTADEDPDLEVIRFILDLRDRSRWLTYTYLLTNMLNHFGKGGSDAAADAAARATLNRLVQSGVLVVDREPREIEVGGTRHRVRLCHLVDDHPLIVSLRGSAATETAPAEPGPEETTLGEPNPIAQLAPVAEPPAPIESEPAVIETPTEASPRATIEASPEPAVEVAAAGPETTPEFTQPAAIPEAPAIVAAAPVELVQPGPVADSIEASQEPVSSTVIADSTADAVYGEEPEPASNEAEPAVPVEASAPKVVLSLTESYQILRQVVRDATGPNRPSTGPAAVKNRLVRRLGSFDEHAFGFGKFKDYLLSAERAGAVKVELVGTTARVSLPSE
jgi:hypothetical protein